MCLLHPTANFHLCNEIFALVEAILIADYTWSRDGRHRADITLLALTKLVRCAVFVDKSPQAILEIGHQVVIGIAA